MDPHRLTRPDGPWLHQFVASPADVSNAVRALERSPDAPVVRVIRGKKMATTSALYDECAAALQFPLYFGENWDALHDSLTDLAWLHARTIVLVIADAAHLLANAPAEETKRFWTVVNDTIHFWNEPAAPRAAMPFHVVLHAVPAEEKGVRNLLSPGKGS